MLGEPGLKEATGLAILNANYMAKRCEEVGYNTHTLTHTLWHTLAPPLVGTPITWPNDVKR